MDGTTHELNICDRKKMSLTGVKNVREFSESKVILNTVMGGLCVKGKGISVSHLDTDTGALQIGGDIDSVKYTSSAGGGVFEGLFK